MNDLVQYMKTQEIIDRIESDFSKVYTHFREFQYNEAYKKYWDKCLDAVMNRELLSNIVFCNDIFSIPPVKTFLTVYRDEIILITGKPNAELDMYVKKSIGAFWGMVFKIVLGYQEQKSVSVSMFDYFIVKTASCFSNPKLKITLEK